MGLLGREELPGAVVVFAVAVAHEPNQMRKACVAFLVPGALVCAVELLGVMTARTAGVQR